MRLLRCHGRLLGTTTVRHRSGGTLRNTHMRLWENRLNIDIFLLQLGWHPVTVLKYTFTHKQYTKQHNQFGKSAGRAPSLRIILWHLPYNRGKSTENFVWVEELKWGDTRILKWYHKLCYCRMEARLTLHKAVWVDERVSTPRRCLRPTFSEWKTTLRRRCATPALGDCTLGWSLSRLRRPLCWFCSYCSVSWQVQRASTPTQNTRRF